MVKRPLCEERLLLGERRGEFGHALDLHVTLLQLPLVIGLHQHGADQARDALLVREDARHAGSAVTASTPPFPSTCRPRIGATPTGRSTVFAPRPAGSAPRPFCCAT